MPKGCDVLGHLKPPLRNELLEIAKDSGNSKRYGEPHKFNLASIERIRFESFQVRISDKQDRDFLTIRYRW